MDEKLNPLTCDLQLCDICEVLVSSASIKAGEHAEIIIIDEFKHPFSPYCLKGKDGLTSYRKRSELRLVERNGEPIEAEHWQPKSGDVVWCDAFGKKLIVTGKKDNNGKCFWCNFLEDGILDVTFPVPVSELEPYAGQDKPKIDFGKAGLILTDGEIVVVTTGDERDDNFEAHCLFELKYDALARLKNKPWRDITAEAEPILEQLKQLMK